MSKIIRLKKSVFDQRHPDLTVEQWILTTIFSAKNSDNHKKNKE